MAKAILLDFFGTVVQEDYVLKKCKEIAGASSIRPDINEIRPFWGTSYAQLCSQSVGSLFKTQKELERIILQNILQRFHSDLDLDNLSQSLFQCWARPSIFPESKAILSRCNIPICLVSNIDNNELKSAIKYHNLNFNYIVTSEDCRSYKPNKEMFDKSLSLLRLNSTEVLHIGDSLASDVAGAKLSGIPVLWVNRNNKPIPEGIPKPNFVCQDLTGLQNILFLRDVTKSNPK
jgi:2-haloacid dehalogenase/putative hydrolase of the HAD superfamily